MFSKAENLKARGLLTTGINVKIILKVDVWN